MAKPDQFIKTRDELFRNFREVFDALQIASRAYDNGQMGAAPLLAGTIYTFVHDKGKRTRSLLSLVNRKDILFLNTARPINPKNLMTEMPLVMIKIATDGSSGFVPRFGELPENNPVPEQEFRTWWNSSILRDKKKRELTRKNLISHVRNKEGGGHVDPSVEATFAELNRNNSMGWEFGYGNKFFVPEYGPHYASVRQIAYELDQTIRQHCADILVA